MVRFECIHCGGRIAVQNRHMDRLSQCPDCGGVTHPLASYLVVPPDGNARVSTLTSTFAVSAAHRSKTGYATQAKKTVPCDNCGRTIGKLQTPRLWNDHVVCDPCHRVLKSEKAEPLCTPAASAMTLKASGDAVARDPVTPPVVVVDAARPMIQAAPFSMMIPAACVGLGATVVALYLIVVILQSVGVMLAWAALLIAIGAATYWVRRGALFMRRRFSFIQTDRQARRVRAVVRE